MELLELLSYVNRGLEDGKSVTGIGKELGLNESTIRKRLTKNGYKREGNKFVLNGDITSNITEVKEVKTVKKEVVKEEPKVITTNIDMDKLNLLLNNLDKLLKLVPNTDITSNITSLRSGKNDVKSLRIDDGLYQAIKERALRDNINIADIVNRALEDYLKNYL